MASKHGRTDAKTWPVSSLWFWKMMQANLEKETGNRKLETKHVDFHHFDFDHLKSRMTKLWLQTMRSSQLHGGIRRVNRWTTLALTIFLLTCPLVVLQVQVAPGSSLQLPPEDLKGRKSGCWQVSSEGRCRNYRGTISHGCLKPSGYCVVGINGSFFRVHRLIAHAFLEPPPSEAAWQVNHIDGNCSNNRKDNLEWVNRSENIRHSYATNPSRGNAGSKRARPVMIRPLGSCNWTSFSSIKLAAEAMSQPYHTVQSRCHRHSQVDGYEYKFAPVQQVNLPGEEWRPMIDPRSGRHVGGRNVSSHGRIKSRGGHIFWVRPKRRVFMREDTIGSKVPVSNGVCSSISGCFFLGPATKSTAFTSQPQGRQQEQQCSQKRGVCNSSRKQCSLLREPQRLQPFVQSSLEPTLWNQWRVDPSPFSEERRRLLGFA